MKNYILIISSFLVISCLNTNQDNKTQVKPKSLINCKCNNYLSPEIEIWNHTGSNYIIGDWGYKKDSYIKSNGWNLTDFPYPVKFDLKLIIVNNPILYENPSVKVGDNKLSVNLRLKVGQSEDAMYPLNSVIVENIQLINDKLISDADFKNGKQLIDHIDIWRKDIAFSSLYTKYKSQGLFINQLIFEIHLINKNSYSCNYEYVFPMAERGEP
jgi:hypothetical protein